MLRCFGRRSALLCLMATAAILVAHSQTPVTMSQNVTSPGGSVPQNIYAVDLNNDGVLDLVQDTISQPNGFTVSIANGDGTFKAPVYYSVPAQNSSTSIPTPIAIGDFNNDGNADVVELIAGTNHLEVFLGKGDGTFQAPKTVSISLPSGFTFASSAIAAADFNQDGNVDLVIVSFNNEGNDVEVLEGNGEGSFSNPHVIYTTVADHNIDGIAIGDFDGDGKPDIAIADDQGFQGSTFNTTLAVLFGNGDFTFDKTTPYNLGNTGYQLSIASGDLNGDGKTDLFGIIYNSPTFQLAVFYASSSRTFDNYFINLPDGSFYGGPRYPYFPLPLTPQLAMADFNGDGKMDLAIAESNNSSGAVDMLYALAGANPGEFIFQTSPLSNLGGTQQFYSNPIVADENHDTKPDVVINQATSDAATTSTITTQLNGTPDGFWGGCLYPKTGNGIGLCSPVSGSSTSPVVFNASANSFGRLRKIELWVDGTKLAEQYTVWEHNGTFNTSATVAAGTHNATFYAADIDNRLSRRDFSFTVSSGSGCTAPSSDGVHVCLPTNNSTGPSPVQVSAAAKIAGTLNRMEIWVDGVKKYSETSSLNISTSLSLSAGKHEFDIYAVNNAGTKYETTVYASVN
jgi:hypothetical protein